MSGPAGRFGVVAFLVACVASLAALRLWYGGVAPTPPAFASHATIDEATAAGEADGRPVLVLATADWCGPCQSLKRGALADERVTRWIREHAHAAILDLTDPDDAGASRAARRLGVGSIPALLLLVDGEVDARLEGAVPTEALLTWLERNAPALTRGG